MVGGTSMNQTLALALTQRLGLRSNWLTDAIQVIGGSVFVALLAQIRIPLPFTPVPITGQTLGVLLVAAALGRLRGSLSLGLYVSGGAAGLPFFAANTSGLAYLLGPTGGYLVGFILAGYVVGALAEKGWDRSVPRVAFMFFVGEAIILGLGALYLSRFVGPERALIAGVLPFIPGDLLKAALAALLLPLVWKITSPLSRVTRTKQME
jgi:biotin transport system substrate-specific component